MFISTAVKLSIAATGAAFIGLGTFSPDPASAITLNFQGNVADFASNALEGTPFEGAAVGTPLEGSVTVDDGSLEAIFNSFTPSTPIPSNAGRIAPTGLFSLNIGGIELTETGIVLETFYGLNGPVFNLGVRGVTLRSSTFSLLVGSGSLAVEPSECLEGRVCSGLLYRNQVSSNLIGIGGFLTVTASNTQSVPEPTVAIGFGIVSAFVLVRKRKASASQCA